MDVTFRGLHEAVRPVCPFRRIDGVPSDRETWLITFADDATDDQRAAAQAIRDACPEEPKPVRLAQGCTLRDALKAAEAAGKGWQTAWQAALKAQSQDTQDWWTSAYRDLIPITATKLVRIAKAAGVDLPALYAAAGA